MLSEEMVEVDIDLDLEEWGQIALLAHARDETINETVIHLLEQEIKRVTGITDAQIAD